MAPNCSYRRLDYDTSSAPAKLFSTALLPHREGLIEELDFLLLRRAVPLWLGRLFWSALGQMNRVPRRRRRCWRRHLFSWVRRDHLTKRLPHDGGLWEALEELRGFCTQTCAEIVHILTLNAAQRLHDVPRPVPSASIPPSKTRSGAQLVKQSLLNPDFSRFHETAAPCLLNDLCAPQCDCNEVARASACAAPGVRGAD